MFVEVLWKAHGMDRCRSDVLGSEYLVQLAELILAKTRVIPTSYLPTLTSTLKRRAWTSGSMSAKGGRHNAGPWTRLKPVNIDPLDAFGLPSKGDNRYDMTNGTEELAD